MTIETDKVHRIKDMSSLLAFLSGELGWELPSDASLEEVTYDWMGTELRLEDKLSGKLKGGVVRQLKPMRNGQPWGIFLLEYDGSRIPVTALRQILRRFVVKRYQAQPDMPAFPSPNMLFICSGNHGEFTFAHFYGEKPQQARLTTFGWSPDEPLRTLCEFNLPAMKYDFSWTVERWLKEWQSAFDVEKVTDKFFEEYLRIFRELQNLLYEQVAKQESDRKKAQTWAHDYALQFLNRLMFLYFIQKKRWLGDNTRFVPDFWRYYRASNPEKDSFFKNWLSVLFFEAFNNKYQNRNEYIKRFGPALNDALNKAPFLNGGLFTPNELDTSYAPQIPDSFFEKLFDEYNGKRPGFFESYNFTISETTPLDQEVAVDPEMIGKVYERLVNITFEGIAEEDFRGSAGIFYTPRVEIDLMCRLSLVDYLANHLGENYKSLLYEAVFAYSKEDKDAADSKISAENLWDRMDGLLREITACDPACGSGSFLIGMLLVLDDFIARCEAQLGRKQLTQFQRRKEIIANSLYGVDVMPWAVHVAELRLWLQLVIDSEIKWYEHKSEPMLPNLSFKVRPGDSLVQEVGGISFSSHHNPMDISSPLKGKLTVLKGEKLKFYRNDPAARFKKKELLELEELTIFREILRDRADSLQRRIAVRNGEIEHMRTQGAFAGMERPAVQAPLEIESKKREVEEYQKELDGVRKAEDVLNRSGKVPFIWNIGFVEIFEGDKRGFDIVIGNPPYVDRHKIRDPHGSPDPDISERRAYMEKLARSVYRAFPTYFGLRPNGNVAKTVTAMSDLYIYFYFGGLRLLNPKGAFCFITSNSWLDVGYGADLQEFLLKHAHVKLVLDNQVKRTFASADVNSIIVLFSAPDDKKVWGLEKTARFAMFRVPFEYIMSPVIFDEIEEATERKATKEYRVFPIPQGKLLEDGCEMPDEAELGRASGPLITRYTGNKWGGKYLRAPDIYHVVNEKEVMAPVQRYATARLGITTGANEFFFIKRLSTDLYLTTIGDTETQIAFPDAFTRPVIRTVSECSDITFKAVSTPWRIVVLRETINDKRAYDYVKLAEHIGISRRPFFRGKNCWFSYNSLPDDIIAVPEIVFARYFFLWNENRSVLNKNFYGYIPRNVTPALLWALLNCSFSFMQFELSSRKPGAGASGIGVGVANRMLVLAVNRISIQVQRELELAGEQLRKMPIREVHDDLLSQERRGIDNIIYDVAGLTQGERDAVYEAVIHLVEARLKKAGSV